MKKHEMDFEVNHDHGTRVDGGTKTCTELVAPFGERGKTGG